MGAAGLAGLTLHREQSWQGAGREGKLGQFSVLVLPDAAFRMLLIGTLAVFTDLTNLYLGTETMSDLDPCLYLLYLTGASVLGIVLLCVPSVFCDTFLCSL